MTDVQDYDRMAALIRKENATLLSEFQTWMREKGLADSTIRTHSKNSDFYINTYLLYDDLNRPSEGVNNFWMFFDNWFIRKAMWASQSSMKGMASSLKRFYTFLAERGDVDSKKVEQMKGLIKEELPGWLATLERYDDPDLEMEEVWTW